MPCNRSYARLFLERFFYMQGKFDMQPMCTSMLEIFYSCKNRVLHTIRTFVPFDCFYLGCRSMDQWLQFNALSRTRRWVAKYEGTERAEETAMTCNNCSLGVSTMSTWGSIYRYGYM
jgi:hypothetical protein